MDEIREREFSSEHHFFTQVAVFAFGLVGAFSIKRLADQGSFPTQVGGLTIGGKIVGSILMEPDELISAVGEGGEVDTVVFEEDYMFSRPGYPSGGLPPFGDLFAAAASLCVGSAYESVKEKLNAKCGKKSKGWHPLLQYFRHVRNAGFHGNHFRFDGRSAVDPAAPPTWRTSVMSKDLGGQRLFFEFLRAGDVPIFLADVSDFLLKRGIRP